MRLQTAANSRNDMTCVDAYTGRLAFKGQLGLFDDNKRDSETAERRIISVAPDTVIPDRRVVEAAGAKWIIGHTHPDSYRGRVIRLGLVAHEATELARVRTLAQVCRNEDGFTAWAGRAWIKNLAFSEQDSHLAPQSHVHFARDEPVLKQHLVTFDNKLHIVRTTNRGSSGTLSALCDELPEPTVEIANTVVGTWDPVQDQIVGSNAAVRVVRVRWQSLFQYRANIAPSFGPSDIQIAISNTTPVVPGMELTMSDGKWKLHTAHDEGGVWLCRATRHA